MLNLGTIMIGSKKPKELSVFYSKVLEKDPDWSDGNWFGFQSGNTSIAIGEHSEVEDSAKEPQRIILNFDSKDVKGEFERIKQIEGIKVIKEPYNPGEEEDTMIATLSDPDGNYFQLTSPWEDSK
jgi:predicted enzyme related to lactoylglutathione lyase